MSAERHSFALIKMMLFQYRFFTASIVYVSIPSRLHYLHEKRVDMAMVLSQVLQGLHGHHL